ncbi:MAG: Ig-like domain-containing protein, partial [Thermoplasmata archaeon]
MRNIKYVLWGFIVLIFALIFLWVQGDAKAEPPQIQQVTSNTTNGYYKAGATINISIIFNQVVIVSGSPSLTLSSGGTANYIEGSGTDTINFTYIVSAGENSNDLNVTSINLNGGSIKNGPPDNENADLTIPSGNNLANNKDIVIDTTPPTVSSINRAGSNPTNANTVQWTVTFSENVNGLDNNDFTVTVVSGSISGASVSSVSSGSGTSVTVTVNTGTGDGVIGLDIPAGATITDNAGNSITGLPYTSGQNYTIDKTRPTLTIQLNDVAFKIGDTATVYFNFSEDVINFAIDDV